MSNILKCCNQPFAVQAMYVSAVGGWVLGTNLDSVVRFCPFCGCKLTPLALDGATAPITSGDLPADVLVGEGTLPEPPRQ